MHGAMTHACLILLSTVVAAASGASAQAPSQLPAAAPLPVEAAGRPRVALPFSCTFDPRAGRVRVQPSAEQVYDIADRRESQRVQACWHGAPGAGDDSCRTMTVHRFTLQCGAHRVAWIEVAAAAMAARPGLKAEIEDGRLVLSRPQANRAGLASRCYDRLHGAPAWPRMSESNLLEQCWRLDQRARSGREAQRLALPPGFAPAGLVGARFLAPVKVAPVAVVAPGATAPAALQPPTHEGKSDPPSAVSAVPASYPRLAFAPQRQAAGGPDAPWLGQASVDAVPAISSRSGASAAAAAGGGWLASAFDVSAATGLAAHVAGLAIMLGGAAVAHTRRRQNLTVVPGLRASGADGKVIEQLTGIAAERLAACRRCLDELPAAMPLRQVIARELRVSVERLEALSAGATTAGNSGTTRRARVRLQAVTRDLQRLAAIAEGARSSLGNGGALVSAELPEPRDRSEAYAVLGVSPDADARITKKLVEALRQSWHPDQARDAADRSRREHRIKQINVAWDLIQGKRVEA